ncbi:Nuclear actin-protein involved in chromatin remodeling [Conglomerata obtusa]
MQIDLDNIPATSVTTHKVIPSNTLIIDNGTHTLKAGFNDNLAITFRNKAYKFKSQYTIQNESQSSQRTMFERDVIVNPEVMEGTFDHVFDHLLKNKNANELGLVLTAVIDMPKMYLAPVVSLLFDVYGFKKIQIGVDAFYSYLHNINVIDRSYSKQNVKNIDEKMKQINDLISNTHEKSNKEDEIFVNNIENSYDKQKDMNNHENHANQSAGPYFMDKDGSHIIEDSPHDLVISFSTYNTIVYLIQDEKIQKYYKIPYGGALASEYLQQLMISKYSEFNYKMTLKESEYLLNFLQVSLDYKKESLEIYERLKLGASNFGLISKSIKQIQDNLLQKPKEKKIIVKDTTKGNAHEKSNKVKTKAPILDDFVVKRNKNSEEISDTLFSVDEDESYNNEQEIIYKKHDTKRELPNEDEMKEELHNQNNNQINKHNEDEMKEDIILSEDKETLEEKKEKERNKMYFYLQVSDEDLTQEQIKEKRKLKMIYYSTLYRYKQRIEKEIKKIKLNIDHLEEEYEKTDNIEKYLKKIKDRFVKVKKEMNTRERIKRDIKNKKSKEFMVIQKVKNGRILTNDDENILKLIEDAEDEELNSILLTEYQKYYNIINEYDHEFLLDLSPVNVMKGDFLNFNADLELLKISEILFEPSIIGMTQPGLREIFENLREKNIKNVLITGGFGKIKNIEKRIKLELQTALYKNDINLVIANDLFSDGFNGACFCEAFPVYTKEEYNTIGAEKIIEKYNKFV